MIKESPFFPHQRRHPRRNFEAMVGVYNRGDHSFETVKQISEGGLLLEVERTLLIGDDIQITFFIRGKEYEPCRAVVVYHRRDNAGRRFVGVRFEEITEDLRLKLQSHVAGVA